MENRPVLIQVKPDTREYLDKLSEFHDGSWGQVVDALVVIHQERLGYVVRGGTEKSD